MATTGMIPTNDTIEKVYSMILMVLLSVNFISQPNIIYYREL